jgi:D-3-phosphoglycerate dehydrogenase
MRSVRILIAEPEHFSQPALSLLTELATVDCQITEQHDMRRVLQEYDVVWIRLRLQVRAEDIPASPRCRFVVSATTGTDHLDVEQLAASGIQVLCLREERGFLETIGVTAELTLGLMVALVRRLPAAVDSVVKQGRWDRDAFWGVELYGKTAGIVGLGRLGKKMAGYCLALGMKVIGWDPYADPVEGVLEAASLENLLQESHVVTIHIPLNESTQGLFDAARFSAMRPGAFFINTSRGAIVDENALVNCLRSGHLGGAALDVLCGEPAIDGSNLLVRYAATHGNLIITPHVGGAVDGIMGRCEEHMAGIVCNKITLVQNRFLGQPNTPL